MSRAVRVQGIECPIIREGDNIVDIAVDNVLKECEIDWNELEMVDADMLDYNLPKCNLQSKSVIGITESVVARADGQYITVDDIAADIEKKFGKDATIALINPIYSRNRFSLILKGIARSASKVIIIMPEYDEVGNPRGVNPFTGVNIEEYYKELCESENCECVNVYNYNDALCSLINPSNPYDKEINIIDCHLHLKDKYKVEKHVLRYTLKDICSDVSPDWGVLGTNKATEEKLKLFPSKAEAQRVCDEVKVKIKEKTGKDVIVCVYGDGCFKDPVGGIWEFADPVTMPAYTDKELIESTPDEVKLKNIIDSTPVKDDPYLGRKTADIEIEKNIISMHSGDDARKGQMGTTPRIYRDLLASLMDLTSGSGDRATPVVLIQNYF